MRTEVFMWVLYGGEPQGSSASLAPEVMKSSHSSYTVDGNTRAPVGTQGHGLR